MLKKEHHVLPCWPSYMTYCALTCHAEADFTVRDERSKASLGMVLPGVNG
jgi:hypothetical protein